MFEKGYWIHLVFLSVFLVAEILNLALGSDPRGSKTLREKFALKNSMLKKLVIFKPKDQVVPLYEYIPYLLLLIHTIILLPAFILYWVFRFEVLEMILKNPVYQIYIIIVLGSILVWRIVFRIIDLVLGLKAKDR